MNGKNKSKQAVLIGAGEKNHKIAVAIKKELTKDVCVVALDGGLAFCAEHGIQPDMIVGDFDSLAEWTDMNLRLDKDAESVSQQEKKETFGLLEEYPQEIIYRLPCEKDDTDTLAAIKMAVEKGYTRFMIYGGLGGRLSHSVANIQSLLYLKEQGLYGELVGDGSRVFLVKDENTILPLQKQGYISVFSFSEKSEGVTLRNMKYEIENVELTNSFPIGVSNEFIGKQAEISVRKGTLLIVIEER